LNAKIIIIGNEILNGFTKDLNAEFLIKNLIKYDVIVHNVVFIKDEIPLIIQELKQIRSINFVFLTGGLGATSDDVTSQALDIFFSQTKPKLLDNEIGTASGLWYKREGVNYFSFPGVPSEMKLMSKNLFSFFFDKKKQENTFFQVNTIGVPESKLSLLLHDFEKEIPLGYSLSYLPDNIIVKLRFHASVFEFDSFLRLKNKLKKILGNFIFSYGDTSLQEIIIQSLIKNKIKIAIAESCTGGKISNMLTSIPGASKVLAGSVIAYSIYAKEKILNIDSNIIKKAGLVSEDVVVEMAQSVRKKFNTNFGLATTGYMGPFDKKNDNVAWLCLVSNEKTITKKINLKSTRSNNILITSRYILNELRKEIL